MNMYQEVFIRNLKKHRKEKKMSQALLAERCGVSTGTIGNIECGIASPSFDLLLKIAETLETHPAFLLAEDTLFSNPPRKTPERRLLEDIHEKLEAYFKNNAR